MTHRCLVALLLSMWLCVAAAQEAPIVRVDVTPDVVNVGESAQMRVTVLVPTWFPLPPVFPTFELSNAITRLPPDSSFPTSERVGRETWSGIVRNYQVYPMLGATYRLAGQTIRVTYANPGSDPVVVDAALPEIVFRGAVPEGAGDLDPYLAGSQFSVTRDIEGSIDALEAGDAIVVRYIAELDGLPPIFIPPLAPDLSMPGVSVYADEPVIDDGEPGRRTETVTLVFDAGTEMTLPGLSVNWWNTTSQSVDIASVEPLTFTVSGPAISPVTTADADSLDWRVIVLSSAVLTLLILVVLRLWPAIEKRRRASRRRYEASEQYAYRRLQAALHSGNAFEAHEQMLNWVSRIAPGFDLRQFAAEYGDDEFQGTLSTFIVDLFSGTDEAIGARQLAPGIASARHACLRQMHKTDIPALPPLNP